MDSIDDQTGSVMKIRKAGHIEEIAARFLSGHIGYDFKRNLCQLFENGREGFRAILLLTISFKYMIRKSMDPIDTERVDTSMERVDEEGGAP